MMRGQLDSSERTQEGKPGYLTQVKSSNMAPYQTRQDQVILWPLQHYHMYAWQTYLSIFLSLSHAFLFSKRPISLYKRWKMRNLKVVFTNHNPENIFLSVPRNVFLKVWWILPKTYMNS